MSTSVHVEWCVVHLCQNCTSYVTVLHCGRMQLYTDTHVHNDQMTARELFNVLCMCTCSVADSNPQSVNWSLAPFLHTTHHVTCNQYHSSPSSPTQSPDSHAAFSSQPALPLTLTQEGPIVVAIASTDPACPPVG